MKLVQFYLKLPNLQDKTRFQKTLERFALQFFFYRILVLFLIYFKIQNSNLLDAIRIVLSCASLNAGRKRS